VKILSKEYEDFLLEEYKWSNANSSLSVEDRLLKVMEEAGEAAAAWIGVKGTNPRKGITHRPYDVALELADVINTAMLAIIRLGWSPEAPMEEQQEKAEGYMDALARVPEPRS